MPDRDNGDLPVDDSQHGDMPLEGESDTPPRAVVETSTSTQEDGPQVNLTSDNGPPVEDSQHGDIPPESDRETPPRAVIEAATNTQDEANVNSAEKGK